MGGGWPDRATSMSGHLPTGNLDRKTGHAILDSLAEHRARTQRTMVIVTHDMEVARRADRIVRLVDGRIADEGDESKSEAEAGVDTDRQPDRAMH